MKNAIKLVLLSICAAATSAPLAQEETPIEEVVVTGTRIQRIDLDAVSPVTSVTAQEFELSGNVNVEELLNELPGVVPSFGENSNNPGDGTARVDLRGLGDSRTLVLVNGRRWIPSTQSGVVDLNTIPSTLIERTDILTGGSSSVYGSDALAGVVNFQLKQDFEGVEITGLYDTSDENDASRYNVDITIGGNFAGGKGNAVVYASIAERDPLLRGDRDFSRVVLTELRDESGNLIRDENGNGQLVPGGSSAIPGMRVSPDTTGGPVIDPDGMANSGDEFNTIRFEPDGTAVPYNTPQDLYNYSPPNYMQIPQERYMVMGMAHYDIADRAQIYGEYVATKNEVDRELAPANAFLGSFEVNPDSPFFDQPTQAALGQPATFDAEGNQLTFGRTDTDGDGDIDDDDNAILGSIGRRFVEAGSREALDSRNAMRALVGMRGDFLERWSYDFYASYSRLDRAERLNDLLSESRFRQASLVDDTGMACQDPSGGCVPMNPFGAGNISQAALDFAEIGASNFTSINQEVYNISATGELASISDHAGPMMLVVGFERREDDSSFRPDFFLGTGDVLGAGSTEPTAGEVKVNELFGELDVPIVAGMPGAQELGAWLSGRVSDYNNIGTVGSFAGAIRWAPVEQLRFRAGFQRAIRAPNVSELFAGQFEVGPPAVDPCSAFGAAGENPSQTLIDLCVQSGVAPDAIGFVPRDSEITGRFGGNPNLKEEASDTITAGIVFRPVEGLDITVDYFDIEIDDAIDVLGGGVSNTLDLCYNQVQDPNSPFCQAITTEAGQPFTRLPDNHVDFVRVLNANTAALETSGIDFSANYMTNFDAGWFGDGSTLSVGFRSTYLTSLEETPVAARPDIVFDCAGNFGGICDNSLPDFKANTRVTWQTGPLTLAMLWRHIQGPKDEVIEFDGVDPSDLVVPQISDANYLDLTAGYRLNDNFNVNLGLMNIFDEAPPVLGDQQDGANTYPLLYDVIGPRVFLRASYTWN